jgi:hypothetical protein
MLRSERDFYFQHKRQFIYYFITSRPAPSRLHFARSYMNCVTFVMYRRLQAWALVFWVLTSCSFVCYRRFRKTYFLHFRTIWEAAGFSETSVTTLEGRAMAQAVSRRPPTAKTRVRSRVSPCGICGAQSGTGTDFFPEYFGFSLSISFHRCSITWKNKKKLIIFLFIFITGFHNKP